MAILLTAAEYDKVSIISLFLGGFRAWINVQRTAYLYECNNPGENTLNFDSFMLGFQNSMKKMTGILFCGADEVEMIPTMLGNDGIWLVSVQKEPRL